MNKKKTAASLTLAANQKEKEKAYWLNQLSGHGVKDSFPFDYESDGVVPYRRETVDFPLPRGITRPLAALSKGSNQRLFIVLAAGILLLLRKYSGSTDIQLGMPVSRPAQEDAQLLNTALVLRCPVDDSASFRGLLSQMRRTIIEAEEHQNFPIHAIVDLLGFTWTPPEGIPLFDVAVSLENIHLDSLHEFTPNIVVSFQRTGEADANVTGNFHYNAERYQPETIQRLARHFFRLLEQVLGDPDQPMDSIRLLSEEEKQRILVEFNDTTDDSPQPHPVHHLVDRQARLTPGEDAVIYKDQRLSYNQLNEKSDRAAAMLKQKGIKPNQIVAVLVDHTPEMVITLLGILKAGAGYLPIDPSFPPKRIEYIVRDSNAQYVVTIEKYLDNTSGFPEKVLPYSQLTDHTDSLPGLPPEEAEKYYDPRHLAYIMYTSGSAGVPKGVMIEHRSFVDFTTWAVDAFGHRPGYRALLSNSYASDGSIQQIYPPLVSGGVLHLIDKELRLDVSAYLHYLKENRINNIDEVPVLMNEMLKPVLPEDTEELLPDLTCLTLGSEYVPIDLVRKCRQHLNHNGHIINAYGPAEASVETTTYHFDGRSQREMSLIGKPRRNIKVYILDKEGNCSPIGVRGEICISGVGIARGYLNRPLLTAEKFDTDLKKEKNDTSASSEVIYKTGDQGCWMADGNIRFLGRIDDQIKVRGFRVELSEIQQVLINMPQVRDAVAVTRENPSGDNEICAYYVLNGETRPGSDEIREYLEDRLPHYMIPSHFVELEKIPLTPNGKVDKDALPQPHDLAVDQYAAPRDDLEKKLVAVWSEVLDRVPDTIGIHNDFFKIGGHSLKATVLASRLQKQLDLDIPFIQVFKTSTIAGLADYLKGAGKSRYNPIQPAELKEYYVLSPVQKRLFIIQQIDPESTAYNVPQVKAIDKSIGKDQLEDIFKQLIARHQLLRTSFATIREEAVQRIHDHVRFQVEPFDLTGTRTGQNESENESIDRELTQINARFIRPFDMEKAPLMRVAHVTMETGNLLIVDMHHTVCDIVSHEILTREFVAISQGRSLPPLELQYKDYAQWQDREEQLQKVREQESVWVNLFTGQLPVLELPVDYPRPQVQGFDGSHVHFTLEPRQDQLLRQMAARNDVTLFMVILGMFNILLAKLSGQEDIITGSPVSARLHTDLETMIGMFVNTIALRNHPTGHKTLHQFLHEVKTATLEAYENPDYPLEELVDKLGLKRDTSRNPLFDALFNHEAPSEIPGDNQGIDERNLYRHLEGPSKFDITLTASEIDDRLLFNFTYCARLFKPRTIDRFIDYFKAIAAAFINDSEDRRLKISAIEILTPPEKQQILYDFNHSQVDYPNKKPLHHLFEEQVEREPHRVALVGVNSKFTAPAAVSVTYREFNQRSNRLAHLLREKGIGPDILVPLMLDRSIEMMAAFMAVIKAGGGFLPIDPAAPGERIRYVLGDCGGKVLLTTRSAAPDFEDESLRSFNYDVIYMEEEPLDHLDHSNPEPRCGLSALEYVIYTSGTTGTPKGVLLERSNILNYTLWFIELAGITRESRTILTSSYQFDAPYTLYYSALVAGAQLHVMPKEHLFSDRYFLPYVLRNRISWLKGTPTFWSFMLNSSLFTADTFRSVRVLMTGGENINTNDMEMLHRQFPQIRVINHYGPAETTIASISAFVDFDRIDLFKVNPLVGFPAANTQIYILDDYFNPVPIGVTGEIYISGHGVTRGYLNQPELTKEKFALRTSHFELSSNLYRVGDLGRWLESGEVQYQGRRDQQVKIRGYRVELGEIESRLLEHPSVKEAAVVDRSNRVGKKYLCAYIVPAVPAQAVESVQLRSHLIERLPDYMVPAYFITLDRIPLTPHGKLDRRALPEPGGEEGEPVVPLRDDTDAALVTLWAQILKIDKESIGIDSNFFHLGGHSITATILVARIHSRLNVKVGLAQVFKTPGLKELSEHISQLARDKYASVEPAEAKDYYPPSSAQKRLYVLQGREPETIAYNLPEVIPILPVEEAALSRLKETFIKLIQRHESLRTSFHMTDGQIIQRVESGVSFDIQSREAGNTIIEPQPFNLARAPLFRVEVQKTGRAFDLLVVDMHHIISDGVSHQVLEKDFQALYEGQSLPPLRVQYKDFAQWQNSDGRREILKKQEKYWTGALSGKLPVLELPTDHERPPTQSFEGNTVVFEFNETETGILKTIAKEEGATLYMALYAAFTLMISKLSGQQDIIIGVPNTGRSHADLEAIIGLFVNVLAVRTFPTRDKTFTQYLREVKAGMLEAFDNQDYQFDDLVEKLVKKRDPSRNPVFDVVLNLLNYSDPLEAEARAGAPPEESAGTTEDAYQLKKDTAQFDINIYAVQLGERIRFDFEYSTKLFEFATIQRFIDHFKTIVSSLSPDKNQKLSDIQLITREEQDEFLMITPVARN